MYKPFVSFPFLSDFSAKTRVTAFLAAAFLKVPRRHISSFTWNLCYNETVGIFVKMCHVIMLKYLLQQCSLISQENRSEKDTAASWIYTYIATLLFPKN